MNTNTSPFELKIEQTKDFDMSQNESTLTQKLKALQIPDAPEELTLKETPQPQVNQTARSSTPKDSGLKIWLKGMNLHIPEGFSKVNLNVFSGGKSKSYLVYLVLALIGLGALYYLLQEDLPGVSGGSESSDLLNQKSVTDAIDNIKNKSTEKLNKIMSDMNQQTDKLNKELHNPELRQPNIPGKAAVSVSAEESPAINAVAPSEPQINRTLDLYYISLEQALKDGDLEGTMERFKLDKPKDLSSKEKFYLSREFAARYYSLSNRYPEALKALGNSCTPDGYYNCLMQARTQMHLKKYQAAQTTLDKMKSLEKKSDEKGEMKSSEDLMNYALKAFKNPGLPNVMNYSEFLMKNYSSLDDEWLRQSTLWLIRMLYSLKQTEIIEIGKFFYIYKRKPMIKLLHSPSYIQDKEPILTYFMPFFFNGLGFKPFPLSPRIKLSKARSEFHDMGHILRFLTYGYERSTNELLSELRIYNLKGRFFSLMDILEAKMNLQDGNILKTYESLSKEKSEFPLESLLLQAHCAVILKSSELQKITLDKMKANVSPGEFDYWIMRSTLERLLGEDNKKSLSEAEFLSLREREKGIIESEKALNMKVSSEGLSYMRESIQKYPHHEDSITTYAKIVALNFLNPISFLESKKTLSPVDIHESHQISLLSRQTIRDLLESL